MIRKVTLLIVRFVILTVFIASFSECRVNGIEGSGIVTTETRPITEFSKLNIAGNYNIVIRQGKRSELSLKMDDNLLDNVSTDISGDVLYIKNLNQVLNSRETSIYITVKKLDEVQLNGKIDFSTSNILSRKHFTLNSRGSCNVDLDIHTNSLRLDLVGNNNVTISGNSHSLNAVLSGFGEFNSLDYFCENVYLDITGAIDSKVYAKDFLKVRMSGAGRVLYKGNPEVIKDYSSLASIQPF
ncbi:MAG: head GIN domain-containing protein [Bacteroidota bacterium]